MTASAANLVDADVHVLTRSGWPDLKPYVSSGWAQRLANFAPLLGRPCGPELHYHHPEIAAVGGREGARAGSDPAVVLGDVLDDQGADFAVLVPSESRNLAEVVSAEDSVQLARAYNEYFVEHWLGTREGVGLLAMVSPQDAREAAAEIERRAATPGVVGVLLPLIDTLLGHRYYQPILAAAEEAELPIVAHLGFNAPLDGTPPYAGGAPNDYLERYALQGQAAMSHISSLVFSGALDRHPGLTFVFSGAGFSWLPHLLWRMDEAWRVLPDSLKRPDAPPSSLTRRRVRLTTAADEVPDLATDLAQVFRMAHGGDVLMHGSDYPYALTGARSVDLSALTDAERRTVLVERALETFSRLNVALAGTR